MVLQKMTSLLTDDALSVVNITFVGFSGKAGYRSLPGAEFTHTRPCLLAHHATRRAYRHLNPTIQEPKTLLTVQYFGNRRKGCGLLRLPLWVPRVHPPASVSLHDPGTHPSQGLLYAKMVKRMAGCGHKAFDANALAQQVNATPHGTLRLHNGINSVPTTQGVGRKFQFTSHFR